MKLTRSELVHAQDRQLAAIGVTRSKNSGWLKQCLAKDFTPEQINLFQSIRKVTGPARPNPVFTGDRNVELVKAKMDERAKVGFRKYGVTTEREDLSLLDWLKHAQMESLDQVIYLEAAIQKEEQRLIAQLNPKTTDETGEFANDLYEKHGRDLS